MITHIQRTTDTTTSSKTLSLSTQKMSTSSSPSMPINIKHSVTSIEKKKPSNKQQKEADYLLMLNGISNLRAAERLDKLKLYDNSIKFYIKGLDLVYKQVNKLNSQNYQSLDTLPVKTSSSVTIQSTSATTSKAENFINLNSIIKDLLQYYISRAQNLDAKLNDSKKLISIEELINEIKNRLKIKNELTNDKFTTISNHNDVKSIFSTLVDDFHSEIYGYDKVQEYFTQLFNKIITTKNILKFFKTLYKCEPILIYSLPGMGKLLFVIYLINKLCLNRKCKINLFRIDCKNDDTQLNSNFLNTILNTITKNTQFTLTNSSTDLKSQVKMLHLILFENIEQISIRKQLMSNLIENFFYDLNSLNGNNIVIIGLTSIPWCLPISIRYRFTKRFFIKMPSQNNIISFIQNKFVSSKLILFQSVTNNNKIISNISTYMYQIVDLIEMLYLIFNLNDYVYSQIAKLFSKYNCTFKLINLIINNLIETLNSNNRFTSEFIVEVDNSKNLNENFKDNNDYLSLNNLIISSISNKSNISLKNFGKYLNYYFKYKLFLKFLINHIENLAQLNAIPNEIIAKYEQFSKMYDNEIEKKKI